MHKLQHFPTRFGVATALLLAASSIANAQLQLTLSPASLTTGPGGSVIFNGSLLYPNPPGGADLFVNDIVVNITAGDPLTLDSNVFFSNVPGLFFQGDEYVNSPIFGINVSPTATAASYTATVQLLGGADQNASDALLGAPVTFTVNVAPEVSPAWLFGTAALGLLGLRATTRLRRRREAASHD